MGIKLKSTNDDSIILELDELGVLVAVVPSEPSSDGALDVFHGQIRFTNVARATKSITAGGTFATDDGGFKLIGDQRKCTLAFELNHAPGEWFECKLDVAATDQLRAFLRDALDGKRVIGPDDELLSPRAKVGRNEKCPCGSGKKYKKCCMGSASGFKVQLPEELVALKETDNDLVTALVDEYFADPRVANDAGFWNAVGTAGGQNNNHDVAISAFRKAIKLEPDEPILKSNLSVHLAQIGSTDEALDLLGSLPDSTPRKAIMTANILQDLERHEEAIPLYVAAIREEPDFYLPYARILNSLKATESAQYDLWLERGIEALPDNPTLAQYFVRRCLSENRLDELADAEWIERLKSDAGRTDILGRNEDDPKLIIECQLMHFAMRILRDRDAELLAKVLEILESVPSHWHFCEPAKIIAPVSAQMGSVDGVRLAFERVCDKCVEHRIGIECEPDGYLAVAKSQLGEYEEANQLCEDCLSRDPDNIMLLWHHWWVLDELDETEPAVNQAEKIYELKPDLNLLCYNLGYLCGKDGQIGKSIYYYGEEISQTPDNFLALENLCFAQILQHDLDAARESYQKYRDSLVDQFDNIEFESQQGATLGQLGFFKIDDRPSDSEPASLDATLKAKDEKFELLIQLATEHAGSPSLTLDLIRANERSHPLIGASTSIRPEYLTDERILEGISGTPAAKEEVEYQLKTRSRGDASFAYASVEKELPNWGGLPESAITSLVEAERIFRSGTSVDSAPYIVAYAKAVEIYLHIAVFGSFRNEANSSFPIGQFVQDVLSEGKANKAFALAKFVDSGSALTLGTMNFFLPLCNGKSARRIPLIGKLKEHIIDDLQIPKLLEQSTIDDLVELANVYRNKAAHEKPFNQEECGKTRELVFNLLRELAIPNKNADLVTNANQAAR